MHRISLPPDICFSLEALTLEMSYCQGETAMARSARSRVARQRTRAIQIGLRAKKFFRTKKVSVRAQNVLNRLTEGNCNLQWPALTLRRAAELWMVVLKGPAHWRVAHITGAQHTRARCTLQHGSALAEPSSYQNNSIPAGYIARSAVHARLRPLFTFFIEIEF